ncbi:MAG: conjugal transfer protein TraR [Chlorobiaceae bacterium]|nr:conjugal transfer protein TraR [Chlorobiaceae bacterium]MBA4310468.1 conjugal transfer protein TraR [Chlorobiaceae bacterium]
MAKKVTPKKKVVTKKVEKKKVEKKTSPKSVAKKTTKPIVKKVVATKKAAPKKVKKITHKAKAVEKVVAKKVEIKKTKAKKPFVTKFEDQSLVHKAILKIKGYNKKDLEHFRKIIIAKQNEIIEQLQNLREQMLDPTTGEYINENSPYSLHMAEQGSDAMEREKTFLYAQRENKFLGYLEEAIKRIDAGTYGICVDCIDEPKHLCESCPLIPKARLEAVPHSQLCLPMKMKQEKKKLF